jgi:hypothetical protein
LDKTLDLKILYVNTNPIASRKKTNISRNNPIAKAAVDGEFISE